MPKDAFGHSQPTSRNAPPISGRAGEADVATRSEQDASLPRQPWMAVASAGFATRAIRTGQDPCSATGSTIVPVYQTATFTQGAVGVTKGYDYSRSGNPTRLALERQLADLEGARFAAAFGSGMAAVNGACSILAAGDHIVATKDVYGGTYRLFSDVFPRYGIATTYVDMCDLEATRAAIRPNTKLFWIETPTNPLLRIIDIAAVAELKRPGQLVGVDNTFATPYWQRPLALGADLVMHSTTKYLGGHSDVVGGIVISDDPDLHAQIAFHQNAVGAVPGPWDAYLTLRGAKTLALRMREHERNARAVADFLDARDDVAAVHYPGLRSHPHHELAKRQMRGFGGVVSFRPHGGAERALEIAKLTRIFNLATSLGGVESLICSPTTMTHGSVPAERKAELGITPDLLRLSVGIEDEADIIGDLEHALDFTLAAVYAIA
jgi:cystathionine beta-lyase/cystathionine gamma-synthase